MRNYVHKTLYGLSRFLYKCSLMAIANIYKQIEKDLAIKSNR